MPDKAPRRVRLWPLAAFKVTSPETFTGPTQKFCERFPFSALKIEPVFRFNVQTWALDD